MLLVNFDASNQNELVTARVPQWSGYIVNLDLQNKSDGVSSISASWIVPQITYSVNDTYSSAWVGIGGYGESSLIQAGTEQHCENGKIEYFAWYELLPRTIIRISNLDIQPGDKVTTTITLVDDAADSWLIHVVDETEGRSFQKTVTYDSTRKSAEWIVERPLVNGQISTLANFNQATLTDCTATIKGETGSIKTFTYTPAVMVNDNDTELVEVSPLSDDGLSFTVSYLKLNETIVTAAP
ncbi:MAG: G1 family glutamic endopeptidase [Candidatus Bathyarchaeia archaeon]|jgi:hypothetical protein